MIFVIDELYQKFIHPCAPQLKLVFKFLTDVSFAALRTERTFNLEWKLVSEKLAHAQVSQEFTRLCLEPLSGQFERFTWKVWGMKW